MLLEQYGMFHVAVKVDDNVRIGDTAILQANPLYVSNNIEREYK